MHSRSHVEHYFRAQIMTLLKNPSLKENKNPLPGGPSKNRSAPPDSESVDCHLNC